MRLRIVVFFALMAASCKMPVIGDDLPSLLESGDPKACADKYGIEAALFSANEAYSEYLQKGGVPIRVDRVNATQFKKDIHELTCSAVARYRSRSRAGELTQPFVYKLSPTRHQLGFTVYIPDNQKIASAVSSHIAWAQKRS